MCNIDQPKFAIQVDIQYADDDVQYRYIDYTWWTILYLNELS